MEVNWVHVALLMEDAMSLVLTNITQTVRRWVVSGKVVALNVLLPIVQPLIHWVHVVILMVRVIILQTNHNALQMAELGKEVILIATIQIAVSLNRLEHVVLIIFVLLERNLTVIKMVVSIRVIILVAWVWIAAIQNRQQEHVVIPMLRVSMI
jgi:hypothetical protein